MEKHLNVLKEAFEYNQVDAVILIDDGTVFLTKAKNLAVDYARKKGLKWQIVKREDLNQSDKEPDKEPDKGSGKGKKSGQSGKK